MSASDRPIFIVGCPRSGTTLFRTMLHAHPRIAVPPETRFLMPAYHRRSTFGNLDRTANRRRLARWIVNRPNSRFHVLGLEGADVLEKIVSGPPTLGSALGIVFREYSLKQGKPRWGDKRPSYYSFMDELDHLFPDAQFIHLVRDGRACVESLKRQEWFTTDAIACMATWMMAIDSARESGAKLGPDRYFELRYEDLVTDPEPELRRLCEFLGEEYHPEMTQPEKIADRVNPSYYQQREQIGRGLYTDALDLWREKLPPWEIATLERAAGDRLRAFGYELSGIGGDPPAEKLTELRQGHRRMRRNLRKRRRGDTRRLIDSNHSVAAMLTEGQLAAAAQPRVRPLSSKVRRRLRPVARPAIETAKRLRRRLDNRATPLMDSPVDAAEES